MSSNAVSVIISIAYIAWRVYKDRQAAADRAAMADEIERIKKRVNELKK